MDAEEEENGYVTQGKKKGNAFDQWRDGRDLKKKKGKANTRVRSIVEVLALLHLFHFIVLYLMLFFLFMSLMMKLEDCTDPWELNMPERELLCARWLDRTKRIRDELILTIVCTYFVMMLT
jgi:hypothetical protein